MREVQLMEMDHVAYAAKCRKMSLEQLEHVIFDCREALKANPNGHKAGYYCDEISYCSMEIAARSKKQRTAAPTITDIEATGSMADLYVIKSRLDDSFSCDDIDTVIELLRRFTTQ
jgi:hypothetical protein